MLYGIIVRTPFGRFNGKMDLEINEGKVSGTLSFMDFSSEFHGEGDMDGFSFFGSFDIPIGSLDYKAEASVKDDGVHGIADTRLGKLEFAPER